MKAIPAHRYILFFAIAALGCGIDLWTKHWAFERIGFPPAPDANVIHVVGDILTLDTHLNEGALFGMGQGQASLFAALSVAAAIGVVVWLFVAGAATTGWGGTSWFGSTMAIEGTKSDRACMRSAIGCTSRLTRSDSTGPCSTSPTRCLFAGLVC
jgi:hypothetical protein